MTLFPDYPVWVCILPTRFTPPPPHTHTLFCVATTSLSLLPLPCEILPIYENVTLLTASNRENYVVCCVLLCRFQQSIKKEETQKTQASASPSSRVGGQFCQFGGWGRRSKCDRGHRRGCRHRNNHTAASNTIENQTGRTDDKCRSKVCTVGAY